ncbi:helix-turn-helix transcriptional regulator [Ferviditalea candida]|uniref:PAS domain-containing protein n=1 Tax=Ferviditalea candida TaxID=3108399 RepID=A0ABU5ZPM0_9BACL|nr:PAS domain-containing protein [Paenibacillaceae bacterium T2]
MDDKQLLFSNFVNVVEGLALLYGKDSEVVLHDFDEPDHSIIAIKNNHITNRKIGDPMSEYALKIVRHGVEKNKPSIVYRTLTKDGKKIKSTNIFIRNHQDQVIGCLSINRDISRLEWMKAWVDEILNSDLPGESEEINDVFTSDVTEILKKMIDQTIASSGKDIHKLTRENKKDIIEELDEKGAFLIKGAVDLVANHMGVSRYTIYNYLDEIRAKYKLSP